VLRRCLLVIVLVGVAAYATLPWWAPKEYLRRRLAERLAHQLNLTVRIGSLSLDWADGVDIRNVTIASPEGFSPAPMVQIDRITADLSPITYLLTSRLNRLDVSGLHLSVESDGAGRLNVASLAALSAAPVASRVNVRGASATFQTPHQRDLLNLAVTELDLQTLSSRPLVRISMSARLAQADRPAPIRFRLSEGDGEGTVAVAALEFSDLDLAGLPLRVLLPDLPLRQCAGRAQGWAELRIDSQGMISRCNADVSVRGLDVQPLEGPHLPTVEEAGVGLRASVDPITGRVWVRRLDVHLPGAELVGDGEFSAELMAGRWEAIQRLNLNGRLQPVELAALLTGSAALPAGLELAGPLDVRLASRFDGTHLDLDFGADGGGLTLRRLGRTIKPAGRAMTLALRGQLDRRNWRFAAEQAELVWGGNRFSGSGTLDDIRRAAPAAGGSGVWSAVLARLAACDGHGQWQVADWGALDDLLAGWDVPTRLWAEGPVSGRWFLDRTGPPRLHLRAEAGPEARLRIGEVFAQPQAAAVVADLAGVIDTDKCTLHDLVADVAIGTGRLTLDRGELREDRSASPPAMVFHGEFEARAMESLAAALPGVRRWGINAAGAMSGDATLQFQPGQTDGVVVCVMDSATLTAGRAFAKAAGQRASGEFTFSAGPRLPPSVGCRLTAVGDLEGGEVSALVTLGQASSPGGQAIVDVHVRDAGRLMGNLPLLADALAGADLDGQADLSAWARWEGPTLQGRLRCNADGIAYTSAGLPRRVKAAGDPLVAELSGQVTRQGAEDFDVIVDQARVAGRNNGVLLRGSGALRGVQLATTEGTDLRVARADLNLAGLRGTIAGKTVAATGSVALERVHWPRGGALTVGYLGTDGLELRVGDNHGWVLADLAKPPRGLSGRFHILATSLDDKDIADWIGAVQHIGCAPSPATTSAPARDRQAVLTEADRQIEAARRALAAVTVQGRISINRLRTFDAQVDRSYLARQVEAQLAIEGPRVSLDLDAAVYGGIVSRQYAVDLGEATPHLAARSTIRELMANEDIQPLLNWFFPGNTVYDLFSREDELSFPLQQLVAHAIDASVPVYPVGRAKTVAVDGMLQGRAAPSYMTGIFPGLNLARYRYDRMTAFAEYTPDGTAVNDMVFSGKTYDIYIEGSTDADHSGHYEVGLILLGSPQSAEWNHTYRQGRIPILKVAARIEGGRMHDESVTYPYPTQWGFTVFLKNNIFYRLWLAARR
jgi:ribosomal protein S9